MDTLLFLIFGIVLIVWFIISHLNKKKKKEFINKIITNKYYPPEIDFWELKGNSKLASRVVLKAVNNSTAKTALKYVTKRKDLFNIAKRHHDINIRKEVAFNLKDLDLIANIAVQSTDKQIKKEAYLFVLKNDTRNKYYHFINSLDSEIFRLNDFDLNELAVSKISDQTLLKQMVNEYMDSLGFRALRKINDQKFLCDYILQKSNRDNAYSAMEKINDQDKLMFIYHNSDNANIKQMALNFMNTQSYEKLIKENPKLEKEIEVNQKIDSLKYKLHNLRQEEEKLRKMELDWRVSEETQTWQFYQEIKEKQGENSEENRIKKEIEKIIEEIKELNKSLE
ncbi:MAG: hypothetical protein JW833_18100 [Prolixibacteraceae bacterium]|nr:hypothetical protein [Prolixibacteraceae bacterium]